MKFFSAAIIASFSAICLSANISSDTDTYVTQVPPIFKQLKQTVANKLKDANSKQTLDNLLQTVRFSKTVELANMNKHDLDIVISELPKFTNNRFTSQQITDLVQGGEVDFKLC